MALALTTLLPTPYGWTSVYDLTPDTILIDELGYPCRIKELSQPYQTDTYEIKAGWGKKKSPENPSIIVSADQQLMYYPYWSMKKLGELDLGKSAYGFRFLAQMPDNWPVWSMAELPHNEGETRGRPASPIARTITAEDMVGSERIDRGSQMAYKYTIPITFPLQTIKKDLRIDPYVLGVLYNYWDGSRVKLDADSFSYYEMMFAQRGVTLIAEDRPGTNPNRFLRCELPGLEHSIKEMGFTGSYIPHVYTRGSVQQRMELIHGILDQYSANYNREASQRRAVKIKAKNERSANTIAEIVRSLGYPAYVTYTNRSHFIAWHQEENPYLMPKLKVRYATMVKRVGNPLERYVWKVYSVEKAERQAVREISVQSPYGLYSVSELFLPMKSDHDHTST